MIKCTRALSGQPATSRRLSLACLASALLVASGTVPPPAFAQSVAAAAGVTGTVTANAELYATPGSRPLATIRRGTALPADTGRGDFVRVTLDGWIPASLLGPARDSFPLTVRSGAGRRLRLSPAADATILADLRDGMGLDELRREGSWVRVRRHGWLRSRLLHRAPATAPVAEPPAARDEGAPVPAAPVAGGTEAPAEEGTMLTPTAETVLAASPEGERIGALAPGARASITAREKDWVRVRVEGWVRERDFSVADSALRGSLSAADLRADPEATRGRLVHWNVLILAHQTADPLRRGLEGGEPYLLAQGPGRENALLYLAIPPALVATARDIPDLAQVTVTARVRHGRSEPVGVPVLELLTLVRR